MKTNRQWSVLGRKLRGCFCVHRALRTKRNLRNAVCAGKTRTSRASKKKYIDKESIGEILGLSLNGKCDQKRRSSIDIIFNVQSRWRNKRYVRKRWISKYLFNTFRTGPFPLDFSFRPFQIDILLYFIVSSIHK